MSSFRYSRAGKKLVKQDVRRDIEPALCALEDDFAVVPLAHVDQTSPIDDGGLGTYLRTIRSIVPSTALAPYRLWILGDSIPSYPVFRKELQRLIRQSRGDVTWLGTIFQDDVQKMVLQDFRHDGHSGFTLAQLTTALGGYLTQIGTPDVVIQSAGSNSIGAIAGPDASSVIIDATAHFTALRAAAQNAVILALTITKRTSYTGNQETARQAYNTWLRATAPGLFGPRFRVVDVGDLLVPVSDTIDGTHPNTRGGAVLARACCDALMAVLPPAGGLRFPRPFGLRPATASIRSIGAASIDYADTTNSLMELRASENYACAFWHHTTGVSGAGENLARYHDTAANGWRLTVGNGGNTWQIYLTLAGVDTVIIPAPNPIYWAYVLSNGASALGERAEFGGGVTGALEAWCRIVVSFHQRTSATDAQPRVAVWGNGVLIGTAAISAWSPVAGGKFRIGGVIGMFDDLSVARGPSVPNFDGMQELIERDYFEGAPIPGRVELYPFADVSGASAAGAHSVSVFGSADMVLAGATVTGVAAGVVGKRVDG